MRACQSTNKASYLSKITIYFRFSLVRQLSTGSILEVCASHYLMISSSLTGSQRVESFPKPNDCQSEVMTSFPRQSEDMNCRGGWGKHFKLRLVGNFTLQWNERVETCVLFAGLEFNKQ